MRTEGRPSGVAVARATAWGAPSPPVCVCASQSSNWTSGSGLRSERCSGRARGSRSLKPVLDRVLAALLLVLLGPLIVFAAVVLSLDMLFLPRDRGGWLYRERRVSRGREFDLLKLRTLRADVVARVRERGDYAQLHEL